MLQTRYLRCEVDLDYKLGRVCARAISSCKSALTPTRHVRNRVCAIDGRRGVGVHLENVHKLRAGNRHLTNLRNPDEMFRYRKKRKPAPRTAPSTLCIWEVLVTYCTTKVSAFFI